MRVLTNRGMLGTGICWMLTESDGRNDGRFTDYLRNRLIWRGHDPDLYDALVQSILVDRCRDVARANSSSILNSMIFHSSQITDRLVERQQYFLEAVEKFKGLYLIFFDPDNGIEVRSTPPGRNRSSKYVYWKELEEVFNAGHSLLVYQHFHHVNRTTFIEQRSKELSARLCAREIHAYRTKRVVFFLIPQNQHRQYFRARLSEVNVIWNAQIEGKIY